MTNGQGSGDTETGVYELTASGITNNTITRDLTSGYGSLNEVWAFAPPAPARGRRDIATV